MRRFIPVAVVLVAMLGMVAAADALIITESEEVSQLADDLTSAPVRDRIDLVVDRALESHSVDVIVDGNRTRYSGDASATPIARALRPLEAEEIDVLQETIEVDGPTARIALRLEADGERYNTELDLRHVEGAWQVERVRIN